MFKIVAAPRAWWPVTWAGVTEDGQIVENEIKLRYMLHKVDASIEIMKQAQEHQRKAQEAFSAGDEVKASRLYAEAVKLFACDWQDVAIDDGTPAGKRLDWSDDNLAMLMNEPHLFDAVMEGYRSCIAARPRTIEGN